MREELLLLPLQLLLLELLHSELRCGLSMKSTMDQLEQQ